MGALAVGDGGAGKRDLDQMVKIGLKTMNSAPMMLNMRPKLVRWVRSQWVMVALVNVTYSMVKIGLKKLNSTLFRLRRCQT
jgi:hypothetical protein